MIGDPPVVTLRRGFSRPRAAQLAAVAGVPTGFAVDAQNGQGATDHRIKPLWPEAGFAAPAVSLGGVTIESGDLLVGDRDGVVVVPQARIDEVAATLAQVRAKESEMGAAIEAGLITPDWVGELLSSSRTRLLD